MHPHSSVSCFSSRLLRIATKEQMLPLVPALQMLHAHSFIASENARVRKIKWLLLKWSGME
jgi:hypothetical protein